MIIWFNTFWAAYETHVLFALSQNSQCLSGPNSTAPDLTAASVRDPNSCHAPVFMSCLQDGFQELTHELSERLKAEVNTVKDSYRRNLVSYISHPSSIHLFVIYIKFPIYPLLHLSSLFIHLLLYPVYPFINQSSFVIHCYFLLIVPSYMHPVHPFIDVSLLFSHQSIHTPIHPTIHLSIHPSIHARTHPSMHTPIHPSVHTAMHPTINHPSIYTCIHPYTYLSIYACIYPYIYPSMHTPIHPSIHA